MYLLGALLLEEVVSLRGGEGINAVIDAAKKRFSDSQQEKAAGSRMWWRVSTFDNWHIILWESLNNKKSNQIL